jgi:hypothetical protein
MGALVESRECLRRMLSRVHALQNWGNRTFTEQQLLARIYVNTLPDPQSGTTHTKSEFEAFRPFVLIGINPAGSLAMRRDAMAGGLGAFQVSGSLVVAIDQEVDGDSEAEIDANFETFIDSVIQTGNPAQPGLIDLVGTEDSLFIVELHIEGIFRMQPEEIVSKGDAQRAYLRIDWGVR